MPNFVVRISRAGVIVRELEVNSKYDAKSRKQKLQPLYPDCIIEVHNGIPQASPDGKGAGV